MDLQNKYGFHFNEIDKITINTFHEAKRLEKNHPKTTEEAKYLLPHPLAVALIFGKISAEEVSIEYIKNSKVANRREKLMFVKKRNITIYFLENDLLMLK